MTPTITERLFPASICAAILVVASMSGLFTTAQTALSQDTTVRSQAELQQRISDASPMMQAFVKDRPILGWTLSSDQIEDLPEAIRDNLGSVDQTGYTSEYLAKQLGSIVALQMTGSGPDFYIIGKDVFDSKYEVVPVEQVIAKNAKLIGRLENVPEVMELLEARDASLVGALKTVPVDMIRFSDIGYGIEEEITIQAPWGEQTKPSGQEGFLIFDTSEDQYYMVNQDEDGNPMNYIPAN